MQSKQAVKKKPNWKDFRNCETALGYMFCANWNHSKVVG